MEPGTSSRADPRHHQGNPPTRSLESRLIESPIEIVDGGYYPAPEGYFFAGRLRVRGLLFAARATFFLIVLGLRLGTVALRFPAVFLARDLGLGCGDCSDFVAPSTTSVVFATIVPTAVPNFSAMVTISGVLSTVFAMSPSLGRYRSQRILPLRCGRGDSNVGFGTLQAQMGGFCTRNPIGLLTV